MAMNLIIKGSFDDAINAASRAYHPSQLQSTGHGETLAITGDRIYFVIEWFNADFARSSSVKALAMLLDHYSLFQPEADLIWLYTLG